MATLTRLEKLPMGIFSKLVVNDIPFYAAEHAYLIYPTTPEAKIPDGTYLCKRSMHRLHNMQDDFETFEITGIPGHKNILFHWGNYPQKDSDGCVLVGETIDLDLDEPMIGKSKDAFEKFMIAVGNVDEFELTVC